MQMQKWFVYYNRRIMACAISNLETTGAVLYCDLVDILKFPVEIICRRIENVKR